MENIKLVRFTDGLDVICKVIKQSYEQIEMDYPMLFEMRGNKLLLDHWLPLAIMKGTSVKIQTENVLCIMEPNDEFTEYYVKSIDKLSNLETENLPETEEDINQMMEALEEMETSKGLVIH